MKESQLGSLSIKDIGKGLIVAVIGAVLTAIYAEINTGKFPEWKEVLTIAATSGIGYLLKNFFTNSRRVSCGNS